VEQKVNFIIKEKTPLTTATIHPQGVRAKVAIVDTPRKKFTLISVLINVIICVR